jgi:CheY-like chemotaxis protein
MTLPTSARAASMPGASVPFGTKTYSILAADDSSIIRRTMAKAVDSYNKRQEKVKLELETAENRKQAEDLLKKKPVDILITDNSMPETDAGIELTQFAQKLNDKPFIAMMSGDDVEDKALTAGAQAFFNKREPIPKVLQAVVDLFRQSKKLLKSVTSCSAEINNATPFANKTDVIHQ